MRVGSGVVVLMLVMASFAVRVKQGPVFLAITNPGNKQMGRNLKKMKLKNGGSGTGNNRPQLTMPKHLDKMYKSLL